MGPRAGAFDIPPGEAARCIRRVHLEITPLIEFYRFGELRRDIKGGAEANDRGRTNGNSEGQDKSHVIKDAEVPVKFESMNHQSRRAKKMVNQEDSSCCEVSQPAKGSQRRS
jgi:hypothetical protein